MPGNPSFDKVDTKSQWTAARNATGLLIALTSKIKLGEEFGYFQRDKLNPQRVVRAVERRDENINMILLLNINK